MTVEREEWLKTNHEFDKRLSNHELRTESHFNAILEGVRLQSKKLDDVLDRLNVERANARAEEAAAKLARSEAESKQREASAVLALPPPRQGGLGAYLAWFIAAALAGKEVIPLFQQVMAGR